MQEMIVAKNVSWLQTAVPDTCRQNRCEECSIAVDCVQQAWLWSGEKCSPCAVCSGKGIV